MGIRGKNANRGFRETLPDKFQRRLRGKNWRGMHQTKVEALLYLDLLRHDGELDELDAALPGHPFIARKKAQGCW